jgi:hypothetical protein
MPNGNIYKNCGLYLSRKWAINVKKGIKPNKKNIDLDSVSSKLMVLKIMSVSNKKTLTRSTEIPTLA